MTPYEYSTEVIGTLHTAMTQPSLQEQYSSLTWTIDTKRLMRFPGLQNYIRAPSAR